MKSFVRIKESLIDIEDIRIFELMVLDSIPMITVTRYGGDKMSFLYDKPKDAKEVFDKLCEELKVINYVRN